MDHVDIQIYSITVISLMTFQSRICSGELAQTVERPLRMRDVLVSIPVFSKTNIFATMVTTFYSFVSFFEFSFPHLSTHKVRLVCQDVLHKITLLQLLFILLALQH